MFKITNETKRASFEYTTETAKLTGSLERNETNEITRLECSVTVDNVTVGNVYANKMADAIKYNINNVAADKLVEVATLVNELTTEIASAE